MKKSETHIGAADELASKWPRTASVLRMIASSFDSEAHRWDQQEELDDL